MNKEVNVCYTVSVIDACCNEGGDDGDLLSGRGFFVHLERGKSVRVSARGQTIFK